MRRQRIAAYGLGILALAGVAAGLYANPVLFGIGNKATTKVVDPKPAPVKTDNQAAPAASQTSDADDQAANTADDDLATDGLSLELVQPAGSKNVSTDGSNIKFVVAADPALATTPALSITPSAAEADLLAGLMNLASSGFFYSNFNQLGSGTGSGSGSTAQGNASNLSFAGANDLSSSFASDGILHGDGGIGGDSGGSGGSGGSGQLAAAEAIDSAVPLPSSALAAILPLALAGLVIARRSNIKLA